MRISDLKQFLSDQETILIQLPDGTAVPSHFHVTEVGEVSKHFVDCGGKVRHEKKASLQLWTANDYDHRLEPGKMAKIIEIAERDLGLGNLEIEVEFQGEETIQKFSLSAEGNVLQLRGTATACLALENCGLPPVVKKAAVSLAGFTSKAKCTPGGGCC